MKNRNKSRFRFDCIGQQVRGRMADQIQTFRILGGDDGKPGVLIDPVDGIHELRLAPDRDAPAEGSAGQAGAYGLCNFGDRDRAGVLTLRAIGQRNDDHLGVQVTKSADWPRHESESFAILAPAPEHLGRKGSRAEPLATDRVDHHAHGDAIRPDSDRRRPTRHPDRWSVWQGRDASGKVKGLSRPITRGRFRHARCQTLRRAVRREQKRYARWPGRPRRDSIGA